MFVLALHFLSFFYAIGMDYFLQSFYWFLLDADLSRPTGGFYNFFTIAICAGAGGGIHTSDKSKINQKHHINELLYDKRLLVIGISDIIRHKNGLVYSIRFFIH